MMTHPLFLIFMGISAACLVEILWAIYRRIQWHRKGPSAREVDNALVCLSCFMKSMQRGLQATKIKSITIDAEGEFDVNTIPVPLVRVDYDRYSPIDTKPNKR